MASIIWFGLGLLTGIFVSQNYGDQVPDAKEMVQKVLSEVRPRPPEEESGRARRARCEPARAYRPCSPSVSHPHSSLHVTTRTAARHARRAVEQRVPTPARTLDTPFFIPFFVPDLPSTLVPSRLRLFPRPDF